MELTFGNFPKKGYRYKLVFRHPKFRMFSREEDTKLENEGYEFAITHSGISPKHKQSYFKHRFYSHWYLNINFILSRAMPILSSTQRLYYFQITNFCRIYPNNQHYLIKMLNK